MKTIKKIYGTAFILLLILSVAMSKFEATHIILAGLGYLYLLLIEIKQELNEHFGIKNEVGTVEGSEDPSQEN